MFAISQRFSAETIELCVRWYITYRLSYRDLVAMTAEHGIVVSNTTIMRWVLRYVPEYERRCEGPLLGSRQCRDHQSQLAFQGRFTHEPER
jgi:transposase-like protein